MNKRNKEKMKRKQWDKESMIRAISAVRSKEMGYLKAAKTFNVPKITLRTLSLKTNLSPSDAVNVPLGRKPVFTQKMEEELVDYLLCMETKYFGLTRVDLRRMAYQLATRNGIPNPFSRRNESAGKDWLKQFLTRHSKKLSIRKPTGTSIARAKSFCRENVEKFFEILDEELNKKSYAPDNIFNVDETGLCVVQSRQADVVALRGKRQVAAMTSAERGSLITIVLCMSAGGTYVQPMFIFPRKNFSPLLMKGAPPGSIADCHPSGWMQTELFKKWFLHFVEKVKPTRDEPVMLIFDGHYSHTRNLELIDCARENNVTLICLPTHSTHKLQPLDRTFIGPMKSYYSEEVRTFLRNQGRPVTHFDVAELFGRAFLRASSGENAVSGFKVTGICPLNRNIFRDWEFATSEHSEPATVDVEEIPEADIPSTSQNLTPSRPRSSRPNEGFEISPVNICPVPQVNRPSTSQRGRKKGSPCVVTSSPYKSQIESSLKNKEKSCSSKITIKNAGSA